MVQVVEVLAVVPLDEPLQLLLEVVVVFLLTAAVQTLQVGFLQLFELK